MYTYRVEIALKVMMSYVNNKVNTPPNAVPFQTLPVTNWNGRVEISKQHHNYCNDIITKCPPAPAEATPIMVDTPHPL